jgi:hypothetical protein
MKQKLVHSLTELDCLEASVLESVEATMAALKERLSRAPLNAVFTELRFHTRGRDPLDSARPLNLVEQLNQTFTYLASIQAARWLLQHHADKAPFELNLGTAPGFDIASTDGTLIAETFAATHPDSNRKLENDIRKLQAGSAPLRYVFYLSPVPARTIADGRVQVVRVSHPMLDDLRDAEP